MEDPFGPADGDDPFGPPGGEGGEAAAGVDGGAGAAFRDAEPDDGSIRVFSRYREKDPYRLLGVTREASFEEVQDARNYLFETYFRHEPSRDAVELAFDAVLKEKMRLRHKLGFRPPRSGRKTDVAGDALKPSLGARLTGVFDPAVSVTTVVNDGAIFLALAVWAAWQANSTDPTLPLVGAICYCAWRLFDKRRARSPDGPFFGGSPIWGALGATLLALVAGFALSVAFARALPLPATVRPASVGLFVINMALGAACIFLR